MIRVGIVGGAGYTGGELLRILAGHPEAEIVFVHSRSQQNNPVRDVHPDLLGELELSFSGARLADIDVLFMCLAHGESRAFLAENELPGDLRVIDLTRDFRFEPNKARRFTYGLPEANRLQIMNSDNIANPGCFATAIELSIMPLAVYSVLPDELHISGITGSTGAGQKPSSTTHFSWRSSNISIYKPFNHQHLREVRLLLESFQTGWNGGINFIPFRGNFTRGILVSLYGNWDRSLNDAISLYETYYDQHPFTMLTDKTPDLKQVLNTNKAFLHIEKHDSFLHITTVLDNLVKGASGQAVQNMNLMFGLEETAGLKLKPVAF